MAIPEKIELEMERDRLQALRSRSTKDRAVAKVTTVVYLNKDGVTLTGGKNDSTKNISSQVSGQVVLPPAELSDEEWAEIMDCVSEQFAPFNVRVTDEDPGSKGHIEAVIGGYASDLNPVLSSSVGGIAPFQKECAMIDNAVVFIFSESLLSTQLICEVTAQEVAHAFGLDHQRNCEDPMTYEQGCGEKSFQNEYAACGEYSDRPCTGVFSDGGSWDCGYNTQNSVAVLLDRLGPNETGTGFRFNPQIIGGCNITSGAPLDSLPIVLFGGLFFGIRCARRRRKRFH